MCDATRDERRHHAILLRVHVGALPIISYLQLTCGVRRGRVAARTVTTRATPAHLRGRDETLRCVSAMTRP